MVDFTSNNSDVIRNANSKALTIWSPNTQLKCDSNKKEKDTEENDKINKIKVTSISFGYKEISTLDCTIPYSFKPVVHKSSLYESNTLTSYYTIIRDNIYTILYTIFEKFRIKEELKNWEIVILINIFENFIKSHFVLSFILKNMSQLKTILEIFIKTRRIVVLKKILDDVDIVTARKYINDYNLLLTAAQCDDIELLELLLSYNPKINKTDKEGHTALHVAAFNWKEDMIKLLFKHNADKNIQDENQNSVLHMLIRGAYYLKENAIDEIQVRRMIDLLIGNTKIREIKNRTGETLLHEAVMSFQPKIVYLLKTEYGILPEVQDEQGWNLLHALVYKASDESDTNRVLETAKVLLSFKINKDVCDDSGRTALHFAKHFGVEYLVDLLDTKGTVDN